MKLAPVCLRGDDADIGVGIDGFGGPLDIDFISEDLFPQKAVTFPHPIDSGGGCCPSNIGPKNEDAGGGIPPPNIGCGPKFAAECAGGNSGCPPPNISGGPKFPAGGGGRELVE